MSAAPSHASGPSQQERIGYIVKFTGMILVGAGLVGVFAAYIIYGMFESSWGTSSSTYQVILPAQAALDTRKAPQCASPNLTWIGCNLPEYKK